MIDSGDLLAVIGGALLGAGLWLWAGAWLALVVIGSLLLVLAAIAIYQKRHDGP